jgi:hypothetical protein
MLINKEQQLRPKGAFYRAPGRFTGYTKWHHKKHNGWVLLTKAMSGVLAVEIETRDEPNAWQILSAFTGFLHRYFEDQISSISINYPKPSASRRKGHQVLGA